MDLTLSTPDGKPYRPLPRQRDFHRSASKYRAYIGGFGSGKTLAGAVETLLTALAYPGSNILVARWSYKELRETSWDTLLGIVPKELIHDHNRNEMRLELRTSGRNSKITGWNLQEMKRLTSLNLSAWWLDEVTEVDQEVYRQLVGRLRHEVGPRRAWVTGNPNGRDWVWALFVNQARRDHTFIHAPTSENFHLPTDYVDSLRDVYPEEWIARFMAGSFDVFEGQVFPMWSPEIHVLRHEQVFPVPSEWVRYRGIDHGITNPTACVWVASDFRGNLFVYDLYYQRGRTIAENAQAILDKSQGDVFDWSVIDPATRQTDSVTGQRHVDVYRNAGITPLLEGNNSIRDSIARIQELLRVDPEHIHPATGAKGSPRLFFFPHVAEAIWEMGQYQWRQVRPGQPDREEPVDRHNHAIAALRYLVMEGTRPAQEVLAPTRYAAYVQKLQQLYGEIEAGADPNTIGNQGCR